LVFFAANELNRGVLWLADNWDDENMPRVRTPIAF